MRAAFVTEPSAADPVAAIRVGDLDVPAVPDGWVRVDVRAGALNISGQVVLVQGAGGGVATAAVSLAAAAGATVVVTSRSARKRQRALMLGATAAIDTGARLPEPADVVVETVGAATFEHSIRSTRTGGTIVVCGGTSGFTASLDLTRLFAREITVHGSTMGSLVEFRAMLDLVTEHRLRPAVDSTVDLAEVSTQAGRMLSGTAFGKLCVRVA